ncbi:MAG: GNAT family N-acetyltransferase [Gammaproteobacteria bacterium]|nr:GNAT family N-acetyltransferase [Gammaproteobacteria bacterium]
MNKGIEIKLLAHCPEHIPALATLWYEELSRAWILGSSVERATHSLKEHMNADKMPMTFVAFSEGIPVGMVSLREDDGLGDDRLPWLGSLVVHPAHRKRKIGESLIKAVQKQARDFGYKSIYLFAFDPNLPNWYAKLGWQTIGVDSYADHPVTVMNRGL